MTTQTQSEVTEGTQTLAVATKSPGELTFPEYEIYRRTGEIPKANEDSKPSALAESTPAEQKESSKSDTEETEAKEEEKDESEDEDSEEEAESQDEAKDAKPKKNKGGWQRRIDKETKRRAEAERRLAAAEARLAELEEARATGGKPAEKTESKADDEPNPDDFEDHKSYVKAMARWEAKQELKAAREEDQKKALISEQQQRLKAHSDRVNAFVAKTPDFEEVQENVRYLPHSPAFQELIVSSENGPELYYELAKDPAEFERINTLGPIAAARELGKFEAKLLARTSEAKKQETKKTTQAPKPIAPVGGTKGAVAKSPDEMSFPEYVRYRREQMRRQGA